MATEGVAEHYQVLEELGRKFFFFRLVHLQSALTLATQGAASESSTRASKRPRARRLP